jgi:hypothetical protein
MPRIFAQRTIRLAPTGIPVNAPSVNTVPVAAQTTPQGTAKQFSESGGNVVKIADVDTPIITTTVSCSVGTVEVIPNPATFISYNNTTRVIVSGSVANVNRVLNGMYYRPPPATDVTAVITLRTTDGLNVDTDSFNVTVGIGTPPPPTPQPPVNTVTSAKTTAYQTALNLASANISVYDADTPSLTTTLTMTGGACGVSAAGGASVTGNNTGLVTISGTQAQINAALATLVYTPSAGFTGAGQIAMSTSDGSLVDYDTIAITVQAPVGAPVNTVPVQRSMSMNGTQTFSVANGFPISVADPNSTSVQVNMSCNNGKLKAVVTGAANLADGFPPKINYAFWTAYDTTSLLNVSQNFNVIGLFNFRNGGNGLGGGAASWPWGAGTPSPGDVASVVARGQKVIVIIGGYGNTFFYQTQQESDALLASLTPFINGLGGAAAISGVEFNNWTGDPVGDYATQLIYIAGKLKTQYGSNFSISFPVKNNSTANRNLMLAMHNAGCLTWVSPQYTDNAAYKTAGVPKGQIDTWLATPLPTTKVLMGLSSNYNTTTDSLTIAECTREWDAAYAANPTLRGVSCYNAHLDLTATSPNQFANTFKARFDTAMQTGAGITGNDTNSLAISGTLAQVNAALDGLTYKPNSAFTGGDTITITTSDGTLSDTDTIGVMVINA